MRKIYVMLFALLYAANVNAGDEYTKCLSTNYETEEGLAKCANEETSRIMKELDNRYGIVAGHKYFRPWNSSSHSFSLLKTAWLQYRDNYCNLLGYSLLHDNNPQGKVDEARCKLSETIRFQQNIETLVKNYQKTFSKPKL